jgi:folate-binding protein YgfZ
MEIKTQVEAARRSVLALPQPDLVTLVVTGKDRLTWLNGMLTCDLAKRASGEAAYGLAVGRNGRIISDVIVVVDDEGARVMLAVPREIAEGLRAHLDHYLVMEDAEIAPGVDAFAPWAVHGPDSSRVLDAARAAGAAGGRIDRTGLGGAIVLAPANLPPTMPSIMKRAVESASGAVGDDAGWESLRLERGVPRFGIDFDEKTYPQEASLEKMAVSFDKGCYLGQEVVCMLQLRGHVKRKLVSVVVDAQEPPQHGAAVTDESGTAIGEVTSAARSPTLDKAVTFASVKRTCAEAGKRVVIAGARAEVVERPA